MKHAKLCLVFLIMVALFASCAKKEEKKSASSLPEPKVTIDATRPGWEQDDREVSFDWYINFPWYTGKWGQDLVTQYITELTGVSVNFIIPAGNANEKLNTFIISGELPDLITIGWWEDTAKKLQEPRFTYNLEELAEFYDPYFFKVAKSGKLNWYRKEDGGVYGYPNASYSPEDYKNTDAITSNETFMVRKDIYEALGRPDMTTPEGFLNALKEAKKRFARVDGQPLIPIGFAEFGTSTGTLQAYLQNFLAVPTKQGDSVYDRDNDPEYIRWLKVFREANELGLISRDVFSDTRRQIEEKITQGRYFAMLYPYIDAIWPLTSRYNEDPESTYIAVDGPKNSRGDQHQLSGNGISGWTLTMISRNNKDPEKAIRFLSFLLSEKGIEVAFLGKQGVSWDIIDGRAQFLPEVEKMRVEQRQEFDKKYGADWLLWMAMDTAYQSVKYPIPAPPSYNSLREWTKGKVVPRFELENIDPLGSSELGIAQGKISTKFAESIPRLILAESEEEFDSLLQEFTDFRDANSFKEIQEFRTQKFLENKQKLANN